MYKGFKECDYIRQCRVGDEFYRIIKDDIIPVQITRVIHHNLGHYTYEDNLKHIYSGTSFDNSLFRTKEDCREELCRRHNIKKKRKLMKEYEKELNEKLNLEGHYIIK